MEDQVFEEKVLEDNNVKNHTSLNFYLPHEFGGCGAAYKDELYGMFNIYTEQNDLAIIKPRWTTESEFKVDLPRNQLLDAIEDDEIDSDPNLMYSDSLKMKKKHSIATQE